MDIDIGTPSRDHIKFPRVEKSADCVKKKVKELAEKKKRSLDVSYVDEPLQKAAKLLDKFNAKDGEKAKRKETTQLEASLVECAADASSPKQPGKGQERELGPLSSPTMGKTPWSSFPVVDSEIEKR